MAKAQRSLRRGDGFIETRTTKRGEPRWQARWHDGVKWRAKTFRSEDEAEAHLQDIGRSRRAGRYTPESDLTVAEAVSEYIERGKMRWSSNTVATYSLLHKGQIAPHLGKVRLTELTPRRVQHWLDQLAVKVVRHPSGERRTLSPAVIENARTVLSGACKEAMQLGVIAANPVSGTRAPARKRTGKVTWTPDEIATVLEHVADDVRYHAYYLVALTTAMRPGEIRALKWGDIDFDTGVITCQRTMTRDDTYHHKIGDTTKTGRARPIAVPETTITALRTLRSDQLQRRLRADVWGETDIVFDRGDGQPLAQQTVSNVHQRITAATGVRKIRMHDLRHTAATLMLKNNVHPKIVSDILGHSSIATTLDIYSHVDVSMQRLATEALADTITRKARA